jgi:hypothetical protein
MQKGYTIQALFNALPLQIEQAAHDNKKTNSFYSADEYFNIK